MQEGPEKLLDRSSKAAGIVAGVLSTLAVEKLTNMGGNSVGIGVVTGFVTSVSLQTFNDRRWGNANKHLPPEPPYDLYDVSRMRGIGL